VESFVDMGVFESFGNFFTVAMVAGVNRVALGLDFFAKGPAINQVVSIDFTVEGGDPAKEVGVFTQCFSAFAVLLVGMFDSFKTGAVGENSVSDGWKNNRVGESGLDFFGVAGGFPVLCKNIRQKNSKKHYVDQTVPKK